ncbi:MAG TPA: hypothetical protein VGQ37_14740 [Vicinamibacterales bacterium]|jgi:hypothetical protein|nr:hypothetical protein [Vicinamibacterales bacterium]
MAPLLWMTGLSAGAWLVLVAVAPQLNPEALLGLLGPLVSALATWVVVARTAATAPAKVTGVMVTGLAVKMVFFGVYVVGMLKGAGLRPVPFVLSFAGSFIALHAVEAVFLRRLFVEMQRSSPSESRGRL